MLRKKLIIKALVIFMITTGSFGSIVCHDAMAKCSGGSFLNPISDINWMNIFPVRIAGIPIGSSPGKMLEPPDPARIPICICPAPPPKYYRIGITLSFWEPARLVEVVAQPYCFPSFGVDVGGDTKAGAGSLSTTGANDDTATFGQAHYWIFAPWAILSETVNNFCMESDSIDIAYMTELDVLWQDDELAFIIQPEAALFANPIAQLSCVADSVSTNIGIPLSFLFWCVGSGGSVYPLSGYVNDENLLQASQTLASRMIYKMGRQLLLQDFGVNICGSIPTPIWVKHNYRMQIAKPVRGFAAQPPGRTGLIWGAGMNPALGSGTTDNAVYILFRKRACCASQ